MKRSKLELYVEILSALNKRRSQKLISSLKDFSNSGNSQREQMGFLVEQGLVKRRKIGEQVTYCNTHRGVFLLRYFTENLHQSPSGGLVSE
jgi:predicted transcriptional regulator